MEKKLKIILCIALIILIILVGFIGVYTKDGTTYKNVIPDFSFGSEFNGKRITTFKVSEETEEVIYDKDGKVVSSIPEGANEADYKKETEKVNKDEALTKENYKKVKKIFEGRLKKMGVKDYNVKLNEDTGNIVLELEEALDTDTSLQYMLLKGDFAIRDANDGTVYLDNNDLKNAKVLYSNPDTDGISVYFSMEFNKEGAKKLADVSRKYLKAEGEEENSDSDVNKIALTIEGQDILTTYFGEEITNGILRITLGTSKDNEVLQNYIDQAEFYAMLIQNDQMPLTYTVETSSFVKGNLSGNNLEMIIAVVCIILALAIIYMICKYKLDGIIAGISVIAGFGILAIIIRYVALEISLNAFMAIILLIVLETYLMTKLLNSIKSNNAYENVAKKSIRVYLENIEIIVVTLIIAIIFTFMSKVTVYSFGMTLFYGIISMAVSNLLFLRTMLLAKYGNK